MKQMLWKKSSDFYMVHVDNSLSDKTQNTHFFNKKCELISVKYFVQESQQ